MPAIPDFNDPRPVFVQIADDLREQIKSGRLEVGARLRSQTELAKDYDVVPNTLRAALKELAAEGVIGTRSTRGTFVLKRPGEPELSPEYTKLAGEIERLAGQLDRLHDRIGEIEEQLQQLQRASPDGPDGARGD